MALQIYPGVAWISRQSLRLTNQVPAVETSSKLSADLVTWETFAGKTSEIFHKKMSSEFFAEGEMASEIFEEKEVVV